MFLSKRNENALPSIMADKHDLKTAWLTDLPYTSSYTQAWSLMPLEPDTSLHTSWGTAGTLMESGLSCQGAAGGAPGRHIPPSPSRGAEQGLSTGHWAPPWGQPRAGWDVVPWVDPAQPPGTFISYDIARVFHINKMWMIRPHLYPLAKPVPRLYNLYITYIIAK